MIDLLCKKKITLTSALECVRLHVYEACIDCCVSAELSFDKKKGNERKKNEMRSRETDRCSAE